MLSPLALKVGYMKTCFKGPAYLRPLTKNLMNIYIDIV